MPNRTIPSRELEPGMIIVAGELSGRRYRVQMVRSLTNGSIALELEEVASGTHKRIYVQGNWEYRVEDKKDDPVTLALTAYLAQLDELRARAERLVAAPSSVERVVVLQEGIHREATQRLTMRWGDLCQATWEQFNPTETEVADAG